MKKIKQRIHLFIKNEVTCAGINIKTCISWSLSLDNVYIICSAGSAFVFLFVFLFYRVR